MLRGRDKFNRYRKIISMLVRFFGLLPKSINIKLLHIFRNINGTKGLLIRYILIKNVSLSCGINVSIHPGVYLFHVTKIAIGDNVSIHPMCYIDGAGEIQIGSDVSIAHGVTIMSSDHKYQDAEIPIKDQGGILLKTIISDNVWIGAKAVILGGKLVEHGCIIAAAAVVTKNVPPNTIVGGVPARPIKTR